MPDRTCPMCGAQHGGPRKCCAECLRRARERGRKVIAERKARGMCVRCGTEPPRPGITACEACTRAYMAWRSVRAEAGKCWQCGAPADGARACADCRRKDAARSARARARAAAEGLCITCRQPNVGGGGRTCRACLDRINARRAAWKSAGLCRSCGRRPAGQRRSLCTECRHVANARERGRARRRGGTKE